MTTALLTRQEAAKLSGARLRSLDKAIEQRVIEPRRVGSATLLALEDVVAVKVLSLVPWSLPIPVKARVGAWLRSGEAESGRPLDLSPVVRLVLSEEVRTVWARAARYARLRDRYVQVDPDVLGGTPVIRGTRVPVRTLAKLVEGGESREALREDYPHVPEEAYQVAVLWAQANPRRGRPLGGATTSRREISHA